MMREICIPKAVKQHLKACASDDKQIENIRYRVSSLNAREPDVSVVIPAFNEEETILQTLASISATNTKKGVEIIVVNNNSIDNTEKLAIAAGVRCIRETRQGYKHARNAGLYKARGKFVLNADADSVYPPGWIDEMVGPMEDNEEIVLVYGRYAFIPSPGRKRLIYYLYETAGDVFRTMTKRIKDEAAFVMGANSAFRRKFALEVDGYAHPPGANEDGYLALKLKQYGRLFYNSRSMVWTSDRRLMEEGALLRSSWSRLKKYMRRFYLSVAGA